MNENMKLQEMLTNLKTTRDDVQRKIDAIEAVMEAFGGAFPHRTAEESLKARKTETKRSKSRNANAGLTDAIRHMLRNNSFTRVQILAAMKNKFDGLTASTVSAVLAYNVTQGKMRRYGRKGSYKYGLIS